MKIIKTLSLSIIIVLANLQVSAFNFENNLTVSIETPAKTVCIKAAGANNANVFFSTSSAVAFEIYKPGNAEELSAIVKKLKATDGVENVMTGKATGDYQMLNVVLKTNKDKTYWISLFKAAGCGHIKLNADPIVELDKI